jgi:hypothetical protein
VGDVAVRAEYVRDLVAAVAHDCLLERHGVGAELTKAVDKH